MYVHKPTEQISFFLFCVSFCGIDINTTDSKGTEYVSVCDVVGRPCFVALIECADLVAMFYHLCRLRKRVAVGCLNQMLWTGDRGLSP